MIVHPCAHADLAAFLVTTKLTVPARLYRHLLVQVMMGDAWAVYSDQDQPAPLAIAGLYAWPDRESEAWFMVDSARAQKAMPEVLLVLRRTLDAESTLHPHGIFARVEPGNRAGETIARCLRFEAAGGGIWRFRGGGRRQGTIRFERSGKGAEAPAARTQGR